MKIEITNAPTITLTARELSGQILSASFGATGGVIRRESGSEEHVYFDAPGVEVMHVPILTLGPRSRPILTVSKGHRQLVEPRERGGAASRHAIRAVARIKRATARHERRVIRQELAQF